MEVNGIEVKRGQIWRRQSSNGKFRPHVVIVEEVHDYTKDSKHGFIIDHNKKTWHMGRRLENITWTNISSNWNPCTICKKCIVQNDYICPDCLCDMGDFNY